MSQPEQPPADDDQPHEHHEPRIVTPEGEEVPAEAIPEQEDDENVSSRIEEPAKVMRIGGMIKRLLDEVRDTPLDDAARTLLAEIHERSLHELEDGLSPDLVDELHRITLPFADDGTPPSDAELRVAQAQLVGWLEGLFHGIQTALVAQQMAAQAQLSQMRRGLPPGGFPGAAPGSVPGGPGMHHGGGEDGRPSPGQYL
ncbi:bacterial proteasome activator family protein [Xylanimonas sp. McL0601]|uniref:bacterial proteasome activator family protein n=1 Tax=Xylanimonas sp. McL0601 TaxID=3414739 RepID=UPI003CEEEB0A